MQAETKGFGHTHKTSQSSVPGCKTSQSSVPGCIHKNSQSSGDGCTHKTSQSSGHGCTHKTSQSSGSGGTKAMQTLEEIQALYGLKSSGCTTDLSQVTISSDDVDVDCHSPAKLPEKDCNSPGYYFDHMKCCLVRTTRTKTGSILTEMSAMKEGDDGFALACFSDGDEITTEIPNLQLFGQIPHGLKRPAALKRPAKASKHSKQLSDAPLGESHDDMSDIEKSSDDSSVNGLKRPASSLVAPAQKPVKATPGKHTFPGGTEMKLGKFTGQSYITFRRPGEAKFMLLICCSRCKADRNGKNHHNIMDIMWEKLKGKTNMMTKDECKELLMGLLLE